MENYLSPEQIEQLLRAINPRRVSKDGKGFSHIEAYDVRAHLTRILGYGRWSAEVSEMELVFETEGVHPKKNIPIWTVAYRTRCTLTVCAPDGTELARYSEYAIGDTSNQPTRADAHDLACKTAESQALKRCATNLGDQFALSLYNGGSTAALIGRTLVGPGHGEEPSTDVDADMPELAPENADPAAVREVSSPHGGQQDRPAPGVNDPTLDHDEADAEAVVTEIFPGAAKEEPAPDPDADAVAEITALVTRARELADPQEAMNVLKEALEMSVARGVRGHRLSTGATIGAALTKMLGERSREMGEGNAQDS